MDDGLDVALDREGPEPSRVSPPALYVPPGSRELVRVASAPHPFRPASHDLTIPEGRSLAEIIELVQPDPVLRAHAHIYIDGWLVPRERWRVVRPRAGHLVSISIVPAGGGGGKNPLRFVLSLAVVAASIGFGGPLGVGLFGAQAFTIFGVSIPTSIFGSALISGVGGMLVEAIAPIQPSAVRQVVNETESPSYFIDQARNVIRRYAPIPVIFGKHRVVPPLGAEPVTEVVGDANYIRMLVVWGYGPLRITDIRIGETPIGNFSDVRIETREGRDSDSAVSIFPDDINQQNFSVTLENDNEESGGSTPPGDWTVRRSAVDADELSVDISLPRGLAKFDDNGKRIEHTVQVQIQYRKVGATDWSSPLFTALTSGNTLSDGKVELSGSHTQPFRHGFRWSTGLRAQYDVRVRRISPDDPTDREFSGIIWAALRTITDRPPLNFPKNLAVTAIDIRASEQLSGYVDNLNGIVESEAKDWNGSAWANAYTRNPASMFRLALQSPARRVPTPDNEIDLEELEDFHDFCVARGYKFDFIQDTRRSIWEILTDICAVARASPIWTGDKWSVVVDTGTQAVRQHITPLNARGFEMRRSFEPPPHGLRLVFANEDQNWRRDERIIYNDGYSDANATNIPTLSPTGITNKDHIWKFGRFHLAQALLRRELWTARMGFEHLISKRGDRVTVQHDVLAVGLASARVTGVTENGSGTVTKLTLDAEIQFPTSGVTYAAKIRTATNEDIVANITVAGGPGTDPVGEITFASPLTNAVEVGALVSVGEATRVTIDGLVTAIRPADALTGELSLLPYQSGVYDAEVGSIPAFVSGISTALGLRVLVIESVVSDEAALRRLGLGVETAILILVRPIDNLDAHIDVEIKGDGTNEAYRSAFVRARTRESVEIGNVEEGLAYDLRLRWIEQVNGERKVGLWTYRDHTVGEIDDYGPNIPERLYTLSDSASMPASKRPSNSWGFRDGGTADGQVWTTTQGAISADKPYAWMAERTLDKYVEEGGAVGNNWEEPVIVARWSEDGTDGVAGADGQDGAGVEYIFARTATASIPANQRPLNSWGFDSPSSRNGLQYYDAAPSLSASLPYLWSFQRGVVGDPSVGDSVSDSWNSGSIVGRYGEDGEDGLDGVAGADGTDGQDGDGNEYIFARTSGGTPSSPSNSWGYDSPQSPWSDGAPSLTATLNTLWRCQRDIEGSPSVGDSVSDNWSSASIVGRYGQDGQDGAAAPRQWTRLYNNASPTRLPATNGATHSFSISGLTGYDSIVIVFGVRNNSRQVITREIPVSLLPTGTASNRPSTAVFISGDSSDTNMYYWRNSSGTILYMKGTVSDYYIYPYKIWGVEN